MSRDCSEIGFEPLVKISCLSNNATFSVDGWYINTTPSQFQMISGHYISKIGLFIVHKILFIKESLCIWGATET